MNVTKPIGLSYLGIAAVNYAEDGKKVVPLHPGTKVAATPNGYHDASCDPVVVAAWWNANPDANIGLPMKPNGLVGVDVDTYKEDCGWHGFIQGREIPATLEQKTGRGGSH